MSAFLGMRGTGDWSDNARPQSWNETMFKLFPNGEVTLTGILGMVGRGPGQLTDIRHNWKTRTLSTQAGAVTGVYIDAGLTTSYVYATHQATVGIAGGVVYAKCALATAKEFREGHQVLLRDSDRPDVDVTAKCVEVVHNGANSYVACRLLEADDNDPSASTYNLSTVDRILVIGSINSQGGTIPQAISYDPTDVYNLTQIFRTPLEITRTAMRTKIRSRDAYLDEKENALLYHGIEREKALIWGIRTEGTGANGKPENTMMGIIQFIKTYASANVDNFRLSTAYSGKTWLEAGEEWFDSMMKAIFSTGSGDLGGEAFALIGAGAALGIKRMVQKATLYTISSETKDYGLKVTTLHSPFGDLYYKIHPLFSWETTNDYSMLIIPPKNIKRMVIDDTDFYEDPRKKKMSTGDRVDGLKEEFLTEETYEYNLVGPWGYLNGVGQDNIV